MSDTSLASHCAGNLRAIAERSPRIHCLTNPVAMTLTANLLLAVGARPSMTQSADQLDEFIAASDTLCVNLGMLDTARREAIDAALGSATRHAVPWVLDPVKVHLSPTRCDYARTLLDRCPTVVRGNQPELFVLAEGESMVDLSRLANQYRCVIAATGAEDRITDGQRNRKLTGGTPLQTRTIATGCALTALVAACVAVDPDPFAATLSALLAFKTAGARAARQARGPGSFPMVLLDELATLNDTVLHEETSSS